PPSPSSTTKTSTWERAISLTSCSTRRSPDAWGGSQRSPTPWWTRWRMAWSTSKNCARTSSTGLSISIEALAARRGSGMIDRTRSARVVRGDHAGHAAGEPLGRGQVQELVGPVGVRLRPEHARDEELRLGELLAQHGHEGDGPALAHGHG